jgi:folylpolyglutamate synthase/dihydropteroate synthase
MGVLQSSLDNQVVNSYDDLTTCLSSLANQVSSNDCIVIFGSFLLVAAALRFFHENIS